MKTLAFTFDNSSSFLLTHPSPLSEFTVIRVELDRAVISPALQLLLLTVCVNNSAGKSSADCRFTVEGTNENKVGA